MPAMEFLAATTSIVESLQAPEIHTSSSFQDTASLPTFAVISAAVGGGDENAATLLVGRATAVAVLVAGHPHPLRHLHLPAGAAARGRGQPGGLGHRLRRGRVARGPVALHVRRGGALRPLVRLVAASARIVHAAHDVSRRVWLLAARCRVARGVHLTRLPFRRERKAHRARGGGAWRRWRGRRRSALGP